MRTGKKLSAAICTVFCAALAAVSGDCLDTGFYSVPLQNFSPGVYGAQRAKFIVFSSDENFSLPDTPTQHVTGRRVKARGVEITIETGMMDSAARGNLSRYTADTRLLGIGSPEIQKLKGAFASQKNPVPAVTRFVHDHITHKTVGIPILSAREVLRNRTGDCTEHAVLTVAILRALGIPSRAVVGMILSERFGDARNVFVFHMWAEACVGGKWLLADATRPGDYHHHRYITFARHSLRAEMPLEYLGAVSAIRDLTVHYTGR
jgi:transglutaminase-like putative cysteine protease